MVTKNEMLLPVDVVRRLFSYDPETGKLYWLYKEQTCDRCGHHRKAGKRLAGTVTKKGYGQVVIGRKTFCTHRIAYAIMTGEWPPHTIDHVNRNPSDNRWCNLRAATLSQQQGNRIHMANSKQQERGLTWLESDKRWQVAIAQKYIGRFKDKESAIAAFEKAARERYGSYYVKGSSK